MIITMNHAGVDSSDDNFGGVSNYNEDNDDDKDKYDGD